MKKRFKLKMILILLILLVFINNHTAPAQDNFQNQKKRISPKGRKIREQQKDNFELKPLTPPSLQLPEPVPLQDENKISSKIRVLVKKIRIEGNTVFSDKELSELISHYENREITFEELLAVRQKLTLLYINKGYINSGVVIPDQQVVDGVIVLRVIEGRLSEMEIDGIKYFSTGYIERRLENASLPPLNVNILRETLQILQQDSQIKRINAELSPGVVPGDSILRIMIEEEKPYKVSINFNNNQSPSVGSYRGDIMLSYANLFGVGDKIRGDFGITEGTDDISFNYSIPVTSRDTTLAAHYQKSESTVIDEEFELLEIQSETESYGLTISRPFFRTTFEEFVLSLTGEVRRNATFLLGRPFSFTDIDDNVTHLSVLRFSQEWIHRSSTQVFALSSNFSLGINAFNATISDTGADGEFFLWIGQCLWMQKWSDSDVQTLFNINTQLADDSLLPMEMFPIGGMNSVRGYRENQLVRDNGVVSSFELRLPVVRNKQREVIVQFVPFADFGWSWNTKKETPNPKSIQSIGAGIRWRIFKNMHFSIYAGYPLREIENSGDDLQDEGIHFQLNWKVF
jgi:hemolysin activation/secretion protein